MIKELFDQNDVSNSTIVFHRLVKFTLTDRVDLDSPGFHKKSKIIPNLDLGLEKTTSFGFPVLISQRNRTF